MDYWTVADSPLGIVVMVRGHDRARAFEAAIARFDELAHKTPGSFRVIGDVREMTGYESETRVVWQQAFYQHRQRTECLVLIAGSFALIRMAAAAIGAFSGIQVRFASPWSKLAEAVRTR